MIGEFLYVLSARDGQYPIIEPHFHEETLSIAAATLQPFHECEEDSVEILKNISARATAGAASFLQNLALWYSPPGNGLALTGRTLLFQAASSNDGLQYLGNVVKPDTLAADTWVIDRQFPDLILPPKSRIILTVQFSNAAVVNSATLGFSGCKIPRGNIMA